MNHNIYKKIAKKHGTTVEKVKEEMELAIKEAYINPTVLAQQVSKEGDVPTPDELIDFVIRLINCRMR